MTDTMIIMERSVANHRAREAAARRRRADPTRAIRRDDDGRAVVDQIRRGTVTFKPGDNYPYPHKGVAASAHALDCPDRGDAWPRPAASGRYTAWWRDAELLVVVEGRTCHCRPNGVGGQSSFRPWAATFCRVVHVEPARADQIALTRPVVVLT